MKNKLIAPMKDDRLNPNKDKLIGRHLFWFTNHKTHMLVLSSTDKQWWVD